MMMPLMNFRGYKKRVIYWLIPNLISGITSWHNITGPMVEELASSDLECLELHILT